MENLGVEVLGQLELENRIDEPHYSHLVSVGNPVSLFTVNRPDTRMPRVFRGRFRGVLRLSFYDVERKGHLGRRQFPRTIPARRHVRRLIRFFNATRATASGYTVHCWQGMSRSPAVALGLLYLITGCEDTAAMILRNICPNAHPNPRIVSLFDRELASNLSEANDAFRQRWLERTRKSLDLTADGLLEELQPVD